MYCISSNRHHPQIVATVSIHGNFTHEHDFWWRLSGYMGKISLITSWYLQCDLREFHCKNNNGKVEQNHLLVLVHSTVNPMMGSHPNPLFNLSCVFWITHFPVNGKDSIPTVVITVNPFSPYWVAMASHCGKSHQPALQWMEKIPFPLW